MSRLDAPGRSEPPALDRAPRPGEAGRPRRPSSRVRGHRRTNRRVRFALRRGFPLCVLLGVPHRLRGDRRARGAGRSPRGGASETPGEGGRGREPRLQNSDRPPRRRTPAEPFAASVVPTAAFVPPEILGLGEDRVDWMKRRERTPLRETKRRAAQRSLPLFSKLRYVLLCGEPLAAERMLSARLRRMSAAARAAPPRDGGRNTRVSFFPSFRVRAAADAELATARRGRRTHGDHEENTPAPFYSRRTTTKPSRRTGG